MNDGLLNQMEEPHLNSIPDEPPQLQASSSEGTRWEHARSSLLRPATQFSMRTLFVLMTISGFVALVARVAGGQTTVGVGAWLSALCIVLGVLWVFEYLVRAPLVFVCGVASTCAVALMTSASFMLNESFDRYSVILDHEASQRSVSESWERIRPEAFFIPLLGWLMFFGFFAMLGMLGGGVILLWIRVVLPRSPWKRRRAALQAEPSPTFTAPSEPSSPTAPSPTDNTP